MNLIAAITGVTTFGHTNIHQPHSSISKEVRVGELGVHQILLRMPTLTPHLRLDSITIADVGLLMMAITITHENTVATVCLCLTGEAFAQAVMCPFLYCMVRDFHVGADKWIGYYAGLLLTGFWGANLATTLFWGYLSDKYGRKAVMLFGLFMTSLSTVYLGLSACYHDAMWALVIQGACTGLVPVSKCAIGELANRQQRIHNAEVALVQLQQRQRQRLQLRLHRQQSPVEWEQGGFLNEMTMDARSKQDRMDDDDRKEAMGHNHDHSFHNADPECEQEKAPVNAQHDFASKGYSALVIALALGAALGPLAGGILTKRMIPGFEAYPYFAPCLLASAVGLFVTGVVALILNETHPKWANSSELEKTLENLSRFESMEGANDIDTADGVTRGRPGYENSRHYKERQPSAIVDKEVVISELNGQDVVASLSVGVTSSTTTSTGTRTRLRQTTGAGVGGGLGVGTITPPTVSCTCRLSESSSTSSLALPPPAYSRPNSKAHPRLQSSFSTLSPATELYLTLAIYTLLVLTSILGSEFVMLYTQSPTFRGGLEFSAKMLGQILTLRGIFKLGFTLCGYPWMVKRWGLLKCLRLGVLAIGTFSVVGLGWLVPWTIIAQHQENRASLSSDAVIGSSSGEDALASNLHTNGSANIAGASEKTPVGMGVILLCLSLVSMGDVLGYVSVLVLFGKSADRMKVAAASRVNNNNNPIDSALCLENQAGAGTIQGSGSGAQAATATQGGSGVLWSVAQVSGNVMRLTGPVIAGTVTITDLHHVNNSSSSSSASSVTKPMENPDSMYTLDPGSTHLSQSASASSPLSYIFEKWSSLSSSLPLLPSSWDYDEASTTNILFGSTSVFYLIGVICLINFIACQYLIRSSSSSASTDDTSSSSPTARSRVQAESSGLALGSGAVLSWSDEQTLQQLEQHQASVTVPAGLDGEERFYSIGHPRVNASFCALHRAPMQTV
ncbi:hypothetical protein BGZ95_009919 [Linnemannia exigua]|uniref:Uncharacterized protein n=1 Tax=Linnemannia exigua TaxID=604196 RepID=A0AAD4H5C2_9FUNG|nr:hypothetical protein BGZ95_009919 [Linnemannia exigua]